MVVAEHAGDEAVKMIRRFQIRRRGQSLLPSPVERVLGPSKPQVTCEECFEQIDRYVELEVAGVDAAEVYPQLRAHLEGCPACREEHDDLLAVLAAQ
jgi:hypothetical protein